MEEIEKEDVLYEDESEDNSVNVLTIKEIILRQIRKLGDICSEELTEGYIKKRQMKSGDSFTVAEEYVKDTRIGYCVTVEFIIDMLYTYADNKFKSVIEEEEGKEFENIEKKLISRKKLFREANNFFRRQQFFEKNNISTEKSS